MKPTRAFFTKAHSLNKIPTLKLKQKKYKGSMPTAINLGPGKGTLVAHPRWIARQAGASKGGYRAAELGVAYRWSTESARKAAQRRWRLAGRISKRTGLRIGERPKRRPAVKRAPLRYLFSRCEPVNGVWYDLSIQSWKLFERTIGERTALRHLGYLPKVRKNWVPEPSSDTFTRIV